MLKEENRGHKTSLPKQHPGWGSQPSIELQKRSPLDGRYPWPAEYLWSCLASGAEGGLGL